MPYPKATDADSAFFQQHGWIAVTDAIDPVDLEEVIRRCDEILANKETMAYDWAWEKGTSLEERDFKIVQSSPTKFWPELNRSRFRRWAIEFGSDLMGEPVEFWYDQFLAKPPARGAATLWHQDEGYWGRNLADRGMTCWMPFHDVDERNGCMHFIDGGHRDGILDHFHPDNVQSDLLYCRPDSTSPHGRERRRRGPLRMAVGGASYPSGSCAEPYRTDTVPWRGAVNVY